MTITSSPPKFTDTQGWQSAHYLSVPFLAFPCLRSSGTESSLSLLAPECSRQGGLGVVYSGKNGDLPDLQDTRFVGWHSLQAHKERSKVSKANTGFNTDIISDVISTCGWSSPQAAQDSSRDHCNTEELQDQQTRPTPH